MSIPYKKQGFKDGQVLHDEHLIKMEDGIVASQESYQSMFDIIDMVVLPETTSATNVQLSTGNAWSAELDTPFVLEVGKNYTVVWDGVTYDCVGTALNDFVAVGNTGSDSSSKPFSLAVKHDTAGNKYVAVSYKSSGEHTFSITTKVSKIKEEYIPDAVHDALLDELRNEIESAIDNIINSYDWR